jgi:hypothetical protein
VKFETHEPGRGGWTEWVNPVMRRYFMRCCDCGLVHEMQFRVIAQTSKTRKDGTWDSATPPKTPTLRASFRARRAISTAKPDTAPTLAKALHELSAMYTHAWDLVGGGLVMLEASIPRFEKAHANAIAALAAHNESATPSVATAATKSTDVEIAVITPPQWNGEPNEQQS